MELGFPETQVASLLSPRFREKSEAAGNSVAIPGPPQTAPGVGWFYGEEEGGDFPEVINRERGGVLAPLWLRLAGGSLCDDAPEISVVPSSKTLW